MFRYLILAYLAFGISNGQVSVDCSQRPLLRPPECCPGSSVRFKTKEDATACGLPFETGEGASPSRSGEPPSCDSVTCLLKSKNLLGNDGKIDAGALKSFMEDIYPAEWKSAIDSAIKECISIDTSASNCPNFVIMRCVKMTLVKFCPDSVWLTSDDCTAVKAHLQQCIWKERS